MKILYKPMLRSHKGTLKISKETATKVALILLYLLSETEEIKNTTLFLKMRLIYFWITDEVKTTLLTNPENFI